MESRFIGAPRGTLRDDACNRTNITCEPVCSGFDAFGVNRKAGGGGRVARLAPSARIVKAFNTVPFEVTFAPHLQTQKRVLFVAADDQLAAATVAGLITELGLHPIILGPLASAGRQMELGGVLSGVELLSPSKEAAP